MENNIIESNITSVEVASGIISEIMTSNPSTVLNNSFKGKIEVTSPSGRIGGLCAHWVSSNSNILKNTIEAEIISKSNKVGGLLGQITSENTTIKDNIVKATISGNNMVGGLIGSAPRNTITINNNDINVVISANNQVGGLGGQIMGPSIINNKIISTIIANDLVGGVVGETGNPETLYSKNTVSTNIIANDSVGGIMGSGTPVNINNHFVTGNISGNSHIGGAIGYISYTMDSPIVSDSIIALYINGEKAISSVVGESKNDISIENVYYDTNLTELTDIYGIGLTTEQMQGKEAQKNMNLDFENIWKLNKEFYPYFEQLNTAPDIIPNDNVIDSIISINQYDKFNPLDYVTVEDFEGDEFTIFIKDIEDTFDTSKFGEFPITYVAIDDKGLSNELTLTARINPVQLDINNAPVIIAEDKIITIGDKFNPLSMIVAYDKEDGIITQNIKIVKNTVNVDKAGIYEITYKVEDKDGAKATKTIKVTVKDKEVSNNSNTTDKGNTNTSNTSKPQTSDIGFIGILGTLLSIVGLFSINRKK